ncbi:UNVERIFIED_CONTAM: tyrosine--tRNA ligase, partial [Bacteroidetes bacterium 56_B9]
DFRELRNRYGVTLQTGGNDQWGNLLAGVELIRKADGASVHAWTTPLITKADGTKFGKTEGGAVWLAPDMMTPYAFYQFWVNAADADAVRWL